MIPHVAQVACNPFLCSTTLSSTARHFLAFVVLVIFAAFDCWLEGNKEQKNISRVTFSFSIEIFISATYIPVLVLLSVVEGCHNSTPLAPAGKRFFLVLTKVTLFKKITQKLSIKSMIYFTAGHGHSGSGR